MTSTAKQVHELIEDQARHSPQATALIFDGRRMSYQELDERASRVACGLRACGSGRDAIVGLCAERSPEMVVGLLAILKSGAAYLPLDPAFPPERLQFMLRDSAARVLVVEPALLARFSEPPERVVPLDPACGETGEMKPAAAPSDGANLAYVMYTSGSTGRPKGVMLEHRQVTGFFSAIDRVIGAEPGVWLAVTSISFDISVLELCWTLARGFTVVIQSEEGKLAAGPDSVASQIRMHGVTHLQLTPSMARMLLAIPGFAGCLGSIRKLILGGEPLPVRLAMQLRSLTGADIYNLYGPTETTIWSAAYRIKGETAAIPIGRPLDNSLIYILDGQMNPVAPGDEGEIYIGGSGVARGYLNRPELTSERFLPDPFSPEPGARMYKTGDLARSGAGGEIEHLGRIDNQVKIHGFRIEPEEIEAILCEQPAIRAAAVVPREDMPGEKKLVAYVLAEPAEAASATALRIYLQRRLPPHMVPSAIVLLESMPLTANGKTDRVALASRPLATGQPRALVGTSAGLEALISGILCDVLGRESAAGESVDRDTNLLDLGATSLEIGEIAAKLGEALDAPVPITDLFQYPTIRLLAGHLAGTAAIPLPSPAAPRARARQLALAARRMRNQD